MRIIALINQKGGCGKTTTAVNLAACLAHNGKRALLIDLDPQGHASLALGISPEKLTLEMASVLSMEASLEAIIVRDVFPNLDLAPANLRLAALEQQLSGLPQREERLLSALRDVEQNYDYILIDSPPSLGLLSFNALRVSDEVLVPVDPSTFSLHGLSRLLETLELVKDRTGQPIDVWALATLFSRTRFAHEILDMITACFKERFKGHRYQTVIRNNVRLKEAARRGGPILRYYPGAIGAEDYGAIAKEVLQREWEMTREVRKAALRFPPGLTPLAGGVVFTWEGPEDVAIGGEFNEWVPNRKVYTLRNEKQVTQKWLPLVNSRTAYRLRINGTWRVDPFNAHTYEHPVEGKCSLIEGSDLEHVASPGKYPSVVVG